MCNNSLNGQCNYEGGILNPTYTTTEWKETDIQYLQLITILTDDDIIHDGMDKMDNEQSKITQLNQCTGWGYVGASSHQTSRTQLIWVG